VSEPGPPAPPPPPSPNEQQAIDSESAHERALFWMVHETAAEHIVRPTEYGRGPWDHGLLHGGPVVGLLAWASERLAGNRGLLCSRLTAELHHGVPLAELRVASNVMRESRRSKVIDVSIRHNSALVARSTSQWLEPSPGWDTGHVPAPPLPAEVAEPGDGDFDYPRPGFNCDAAELRYVEGSNELSGPATVWVRLTSPLIAGLVPSPFVRVAAVADLAAAAGFERGANDEAFINVDVTLQLDRPPVSEWLALDAKTHRWAGGVGHNEATVFDEGGSFGRILQSLVETPAQSMSWAR